MSSLDWPTTAPASYGKATTAGWKHLALFGPGGHDARCPFVGVERTSRLRAPMSEIDPTADVSDLIELVSRFQLPARRGLPDNLVIRSPCPACRATCE